MKTYQKWSHPADKHTDEVISDSQKFGIGRAKYALGVASSNTISQCV